MTNFLLPALGISTNILPNVLTYLSAINHLNSHHVGHFYIVHEILSNIMNHSILTMYFYQMYLLSVLGFTTDFMYCQIYCSYYCFITTVNNFKPISFTTDFIFCQIYFSYYCFTTTLNNVKHL